MVNECTWYCNECNEGYCEHCDKGEEIDGEIYCDECAVRKSKEDSA